MFFVAKDGNCYPVASVTSYQYEGDELLVKLIGHTKPIAAHSGSAKIFDRIGSIFAPAAPKTFFVGIEEEGGSPSAIWVTPLIGWMISASGHAEPVTSNGASDGVTNDYAILHPTGQISRFDETEYLSLTDLLEQLDLPDPALNRAIEDARKAQAVVR